jgi:hypothetical protein
MEKATEELEKKLDFIIEEQRLEVKRFTELKK